MTAYNVLSRAGLLAGKPEDISLIVQNLDAIAQIVNGNLGTDNWAAGKIFDLTKLIRGTAVDGQVIGWDIGDWKPRWGSGPAFNAKDYGAVGDGVADDTVAIQAVQAAATAAGTPVTLPPGTYKTTLASSAFSGPLVGPGQVKDVGPNKRAPRFAATKTRPSPLGVWTSPEIAYNGDLSHLQMVIEHRITGVATLGQPATGYLNNQDAGPAHIYLYNESGWNQATASNDGRTGAAAQYTQVYHIGQGDVACQTAFAFTASAPRAGATSFLANAAGTLFNGNSLAGSNGIYLDVIEVTAEDQGFDVAAVGLVLNMKRGNNTGALDTMWNGLRVQSIGTKAVDVGLMLVNAGGGAEGFKVGIDLAASVLATSGTWIKAAITLAADQRIYFNATGSDAGSSIYRRPSATGNSYIEFNTGITGLNVVVGGTSLLQLQPTLTLSTATIGVAAGRVYQVNGVNVVGARQTGWAAPTGTLSRLTFDQSTVTLAQLAQRVAALVTDLTTHGLIGV